MTIKTANKQRMSRTAAEGMAARRFRIQAFVGDHYDAHKTPLCIEDIRVGLGDKTGVVKAAVMALIVDGKLRVVGWAVDAGRTDISAKEKMYAPAHAPLLPSYVSRNDEIQGQMAERERRQREHDMAIKHEAAMRELAKPVARVPRTGSGQIGAKYQPEFRPLTPEGCDWRDVAAMRMLCRG